MARPVTVIDAAMVANSPTSTTTSASRRVTRLPACTFWCHMLRSASRRPSIQPSPDSSVPARPRTPAGPFASVSVVAIVSTTTCGSTPASASLHPRVGVVAVHVAEQRHGQQQDREQRQEPVEGHGRGEPVAGVGRVARVGAHQVVEERAALAGAGNSATGETISAPARQQADGVAHPLEHRGGDRPGALRAVGQHRVDLGRVGDAAPRSARGPARTAPRRPAPRRP